MTVKKNKSFPLEMENLTEQESREVLGRQREEVGSGHRIQEARGCFRLNKTGRTHGEAGGCDDGGLQGFPLACLHLLPPRNGKAGHQAGAALRTRRCRLKERV